MTAVQPRDAASHEDCAKCLAGDTDSRNKVRASLSLIGGDSNSQFGDHASFAQESVCWT